MAVLVRLLGLSARHGAALLAAAIAGGILVPPAAHALRWMVGPVVVGLTTLVLLRVDIAAAFAHLRAPLRLFAIVFVEMAVCPVLAAFAVSAIPLDQGIADAVVIFSTGATIASAPALARMVGLDAELALLGTLLSTIAVPFVAPPIVWALIGVDLAISMSGFAARLGLVVGLPLLLSWAIRRLLGPRRLQTLGPAFDGMAVWLLVLFGFGVMDGVGPRLLREPGWILGTTLIAALVVAGLNAATTVLLLPLGRRIAATAGMLSGFRSMALYLAVLPAAADERVALFFGLYQIPLYLGPLVMQPLYRRLRLDDP